MSERTISEASVFEFKSTHLDETGSKRIAESIRSENLKDKKWAS